MAYSDRAGHAKIGGKKFEANRLTLTEERLLEEHLKSNQEVADFVSELRAVMRHKVRTGLHEGDWVEDPVRVYFDGGVFAEQVKSASDVKLQIALCVDVSKSTYTNQVAGKIGAALIGIDRTIRKAMVELPEGALTYKVFAFNANTYPVSESQIVPNFDLRAKVAVPDKEDKIIENGTWIRWGTYTVTTSSPRAPLVSEKWIQTTLKNGAVVYRQSGLSEMETNILLRSSPFRCESKYDNNWQESLVTPLFTAIEAWEHEKGDHSAHRIDIILTDGEWDRPEDIASASLVQERRNGKLTTFMLNFLPRSLWGHHALPERCYQYEANTEFLGEQIRQIISDSLLDLA